MYRLSIVADTPTI